MIGFYKEWVSEYTIKLVYKPTTNLKEDGKVTESHLTQLNSGPVTC